MDELIERQGSFLRWTLTFAVDSEVVRVYSDGVPLSIKTSLPSLYLVLFSLQDRPPFQCVSLPIFGLKSSVTTLLTTSHSLVHRLAEECSCFVIADSWSLPEIAGSPSMLGCIETLLIPAASQVHLVYSCTHYTVGQQSIC